MSFDLDAAIKQVDPAGGSYPEHTPDFAVVTCADARIKLQAAFPDANMFVVRVAGNTVGDRELASLDYAVAHLGIKQIVILGHTGCGAVGAWFDGVDSPELASLVNPIDASVTALGFDRSQIANVNLACAINAVSQAKLLAQKSSSTGLAVKGGKVQVLAALVDLSAPEAVVIDAQRIVAAAS